MRSPTTSSAAPSRSIRPIRACPNGVIESLQTKLDEVWLEWTEQHKLTVRAYRFDDIEHHEFVSSARESVSRDEDEESDAADSVTSDGAEPEL